MSSFKGKVVLVTGACGGIGKETVYLFAEREADLVLVDINGAGLEQVAEQCKARGAGEVTVMVADLTVEKEIESVIKKTNDQFHRLDVLVNNAGIGLAQKISKVSWRDYDKIMDTNLKGPFFLTKGFMASLIETKGSIVNISSGMGMFPSCLHIVYCLSKSAMNHFTRCLAQEQAKNGVRVNSVCPGIVNTPLTGSDEKPSMLRLLADPLQPFGGIIEPDEIAKWVVHLSSADAGPITGQCVAVDGGNSITMLPKGYFIPTTMPPLRNKL